MRTSGAGGGGGIIIGLPLLMLLVFVVWMAGGPGPSAAWLERQLESVVAWVSDRVR